MRIGLQRRLDHLQAQVEPRDVPEEGSGEIALINEKLLKKMRTILQDQTNCMNIIETIIEDHVAHEHKIREGWRQDVAARVQLAHEKEKIIALRATQNAEQQQGYEIIAGLAARYLRSAAGTTREEGAMATTLTKQVDVLASDISEYCTEGRGGPADD